MRRILLPIFLLLFGGGSVICIFAEEPQSGGVQGKEEYFNKPNPESPNGCADPPGSFYRWRHMAAMPVGEPLRTFDNLQNFLAPDPSGKFNKPWQLLYKKRWDFTDDQLGTMYAAAMQGEGSNFKKIAVPPCTQLVDMMLGFKTESGEIQPHTIGLPTLADWEDREVKSAWIWPLNGSRVAYFFEDCSNPSFQSVFSVVKNEPTPVLEKPVVDIKANAMDGIIQIPYQSIAKISWTSKNCDTLAISPTGWTGLENPGLNDGPLELAKTYTALCKGSGGEAMDNVTVLVSPPPPPPLQPLPPPAPAQPSIANASANATINVPKEITLIHRFPDGMPGITVSPFTLAPPVVSECDCPNSTIEFASSLLSRTPFAVFKPWKLLELGASVGVGAGGSFGFSDDSQRVHAGWQAAGYSAAAYTGANLLNPEQDIARVRIDGRAIGQIKRGQELRLPDGRSKAVWDKEGVKILVPCRGGWKLCTFAKPGRKINFTPVIYPLKGTSYCWNLIDGYLQPKPCGNPPARPGTGPDPVAGGGNNTPPPRP